MTRIFTPSVLSGNSSVCLPQKGESEGGKSKTLNFRRNAFLFLTLSFVSFSACLAQTVTTKETAKGKALEYYQQADNDIAFNKLPMADSLLKMAVREKDNFIDAWILIGQLQAQGFRNYERAAAAYEKVKLLKADYWQEVDFQLGICYMNLGRYDKAKASLSAFMSMPKIPAQSRMLSEKMIADCDFATGAMQHPVPFSPQNLGRGVNTPDDESMPSLTADGKYLYFTRHFGEGIYQDEDIFMSIATSAGFAPATSIGSAINTEQYIEGAQNISANGKYLFFTGSGRPDALGSADIYMSRKVGDQWERANNLGSPVNTPGYETQPCISADGKKLFYAGIRANGLGGTDIYYSSLNPDGTWSQPLNLGSTVNTMYDEMRPFIHADGRTLYFSSRGHRGFGNFDIYVTRLRDDGSWSEPENLCYPINTAGDELGMFVTADGSTAFYASEQKDSYGQMDIYRFDMPAAARPAYTSYIKGNVFDSESREPIATQIQVYDLETGKLYTSMSGDKITGQFLSTLPAGKDYGVEVMKDGYLFYSHNISLKDVTGGAPFVLDIPLKKIRVGEKMVLNNIFFNTEQYELKRESNAELDVVVKMMQKNPGMKMEVSGHTDNSGDERRNQALSENRAKAVYEYLLSKGVEDFRLTYKGYASTRPVAPNDTPENKAKNRRTELAVMGL